MRPTYLYRVAFLKKTRRSSAILSRKRSSVRQSDSLFKLHSHAFVLWTSWKGEAPLLGRIGSDR